MTNSPSLNSSVTKTEPPGVPHSHDSMSIDIVILQVLFRQQYWNKWGMFSSVIPSSTFLDVFHL